MILYELLLGERPDQRGEEPPSLSQRWAALSAERKHELAAERGLTPRALGRLLRGPLEAMAGTAVPWDRERRYSTARERGEDVIPCLRGESLPGRFRGRKRRPWRLRRWSTILGGTAALLIGLAAMVFLAKPQSCPRETPNSTACLTRLPDARFLVVWEEEVPNERCNSDCFASWISPTGVLGPKSLLNSFNETGDGWEFGPAAAVMIGSTVATPLMPLLFVAWGDGVPQGPAFQVNTKAPTTRVLSPTVAVGPSGEFMVAWWDWDVHARRYDPDGVPIGDQFLVSSSGGRKHGYYAALAYNSTGVLTARSCAG